MDSMLHEQLKHQRSLIANTDSFRRLIEPFQLGETSTYISHIKLGLDELASHPTSLLVFSGGDTKREKTGLAEATSYRNLALANDLFGHPTSSASRVFTDDYATDSLQNVLFPLVGFASHALTYQGIGKPRNENIQDYRKIPKTLTIIGHEFKRRRFEDLHLPAIRWPIDALRFKYIGMDPPMDPAKRIEVLRGESLRGYGAWRKDMYGAGELLANKRTRRGWTAEQTAKFQAIVSRGWQHSVSKNDILALLMWNGGASRQELYPEKLPWESVDC